MSHIKLLFVFVALFTWLSAVVSQAQPGGQVPGKSCIVYVGTSTDTPGKSKGIYAYRMDVTSGAFSPLGAVAETPNPTFLDLDARGHFLYAVNEVNEFLGKPGGGVSAYAIDAATGKLTLLNQRSSMGAGPCHVLIDRNGKAALVANYAGGNIAELPIQPDGGLAEAASFFQYEGHGPNEKRQEAAHAHCVALDPLNRFAFACDLGTDKVMSYHFDPATGKLTPNDPAFTALKPGSGPRHLTFHPNGRIAYVLNELACTVTVFAYNPARGSLKEVQTIATLPDDFKDANTSAEVAVDRLGKHLYASNRGHNSIALFDIDAAKGTLTLVERTSTGGKTPRDFTIDPTGKFLAAANQESNNIVIFGIDEATGRLKPTGQVLDLPAPMCVRFMPLYVR
jgi:6-phosphogluconolactonase